MHALKRDTSYKYQFPRFTVWFFKLKSYNAIWRCYIIYPKGRLPLIKLPWAEQMATAFLSTLYWRWKYFFFLLLISLCSPSSGVANILYWGVSYYLFVFLSFLLSFSWSCHVMPCHVSSSVWRSDKRGCDKFFSTYPIWGMCLLISVTIRQKGVWPRTCQYLTLAHLLPSQPLPKASNMSRTLSHCYFQLLSKMLVWICDLASTWSEEV